MKLATNLQVAVQTLTFSESVLPAERGGIPRATAAEECSAVFDVLGRVDHAE